MPRLIVFWEGSSKGVGSDELDVWATRTVARLDSSATLARAELLRLEGGVQARVRILGGWLLELETAAGAGVTEALCDPVLEELFGDLRLMGAAPTVAVIA